MSHPQAEKQCFYLSDFLTPEEEKILLESERQHQSPTLYLFKERMRKNYRNLRTLYPNIEIYYAVKCCPAAPVLSVLIEEGSNFDIASIYELDQVLRLGADPTKISYGNTIKKEKDIAYAYGKGIRMFATDSDEDIEKLARSAPGARVYFRILTPAYAADWPLSKKFGSEKHVTIRLAEKARDLGLVPYGVSFHVGSQQRAVEAWEAALDGARTVFDRLKEKGIALSMINLGGGLPTQYISNIPDEKEYKNAIEGYIEKYFGGTRVRILQEPGRSLAGSIGVIASEVVLVSKKSDLPQEPRWVYLDLGKFSGLPETLDEAIKYPLCMDQAGEASSPVILAGPTCDSADILYENYRYFLPNSLKSGDRIYIMATGAYTSTYSAIEFNGFPPLNTVIVDEKQ